VNLPFLVWTPFLGASIQHKRKERRGKKILEGKRRGGIKVGFCPGLFLFLHLLFALYRKKGKSERGEERGN